MTDDDGKRPKPKLWENQNYGKVQKSKKHENRVARELGGKRLPRSGANRWSKWDKATANGDIAVPEIHVEHKRTEKDSMSLKREWLEKVTIGSRAQAKEPAMVLTFEDATSFPQDWALIPLDMLKQLLALSRKA